jgi:hypothetical protein
MADPISVSNAGLKSAVIVLRFSMSGTRVRNPGIGTKRLKVVLALDLEKQVVLMVKLA